MSGWLDLHRQLYNAALEERIDAWRKHHKNISYNEQQNVLPALKKDLPELTPLGSQALQETLRRLDRAFSAFYRRCAAGQTPGFPRFKGKKSFNSFCFPSPAGWCFLPFDKPPLDNSTGDMAKAACRTSALKVGSLLIRARGKSRFDSYAPNDLTIKRVAPKIWEASITLRVSDSDCARDRIGNEIRGFDLGVTDKVVFDNGETVENTRFLRNKLDELAKLQRARARCSKKGSRNYKALNQRIARLHRRIAHQRKDELHKLTTNLVKTCSILGSEELNVSGMVRVPKPKPEVGVDGAPTGNFLPNGAAAKAGLNREISSVSMSALLGMLAYKAIEADTRLHLSNTRKVKPTQRCACCGTLVKKHLDERTHLCTHCGFVATRDRNAALVCLIDALWPEYFDAITSKISKDGQRKNLFFPDGFENLIANRLFYAAQDISNIPQVSNISNPSPKGAAHGTGVVIGTDIVELVSQETPPRSALAV